MLHKAEPSYIRESIYGPEIKKRAGELPGIEALEIRDLFPDVPHEIFLEGGDLSVIRKATEEALKKVNMNMIKPNDTVNLLSSQYGFQIMGGQAYAEMLRTIKDVVEGKTGCKNIRLRVATGFRIREPLEIAEEYN